MHLRRFREADRLADQAFNARPYGQMLALDLLRIAFAWAGLVGVQMPGVGPRIIGVVAGEPEGLEQRFKLHQDVIFAATEDVGQDLAGVMIDGMPQPARVVFAPDKRSHLIHLCLRFTRTLHVPGDLGRVQRAQHRGVHRLQCRFRLLEFTQHGIGTDMQ